MTVCLTPNRESGEARSRGCVATTVAMLAHPAGSKTKQTRDLTRGYMSVTYASEPSYFSVPEPLPLTWLQLGRQKKRERAQVEGSTSELPVHRENSVQSVITWSEFPGLMAATTSPSRIIA